MILTDPKLDWLRREISDFVERQMGDYLKNLRFRAATQDLPKHPKILRDAVWGNIELSASEVLLLDTPIIQRLRYIGNLGLAYLIFPGATHSRFEHTLGVTHIAGNIVQHLIPLHDVSNECLPVDITSLVRIAALFHDTGHIVCSHAGEKYFSGPFYSRADSISALIDHLSKQLPSGRVALGELLSALIVTSEPIIELIDIAFSLADVSQPTARPLATQTAFLAAEFILGYSSIDRLWPYAAIINGPIDADKCDYLARDALQTGVPVLVDLQRLTHKLVPISLTDISDESVSHPPYVLGIHGSALSSVEELTISRRLMYEKVYYHHKVQTAETMFFEALKRIEKGAPKFFSSFDHILRMTDQDLIHYEAKANLRDWAKRLGIAIVDEETFLSGGALLECLARRHLHYRVVELPALTETQMALFMEEYEPFAAAELEKMNCYFFNEQKLYTSFCPLISTLTEITQTIPNLWVQDSYGPIQYVEHPNVTIFTRKRGANVIIAPREGAAQTVLITESFLWKKLGLGLEPRQWLHLKAKPEAVDRLRDYLNTLGYYESL